MGVDGSAPAAAAVAMLGLAGFRVLAAGELGGELRVRVETEQAVIGCPGCGVLATAHGRREHRVRDVPAGARPVMLVWWKRLWRCEEPLCPRRSWSEQHPAIRARAVLTERARAWSLEQVCAAERSVESVRRELGVGWATVMRAVRGLGLPLIEDPARLAGVSAFGVDETMFLAATPTRPTRYVTGLVDIRRGRLLDVLDGRDQDLLAGWLATRPRTWRDGIDTLALDPSGPYRAGLVAGFTDRAERGLAAPVMTVDHFHVVRLGNDTVDSVRRRVQRQTTGRRGRRDDPLYRIRRLLLRGQERLTPKGAQRLVDGMAQGDPSGHLALAWHAKERLRRVYTATDHDHAKLILTSLTRDLRRSEVPELRTLARTLRGWDTEILAYHHTGGASNGPTEATNLIIEKTRRVGHGYRNFDNYRLRLLLRSGLDWHTRPTPRIRSRRPRLVA